MPNNDMMNNNDIISVAFLTGFMGDIGLQLLVASGMGGPSGWGLKSYFKQHGPLESMFIAGGMLAGFYMIYIYILGLPIHTHTHIYYIGIYGIIIDYIFRKFMIFSSLKGYYAYMNYYWSAFWIFVPMILPIGLYKLLRML